MDAGAPAISSRIAFGAQFIKESENLTDERTVEYTAENPYMQYFLGLREYRDTPLFDSSLMAHFRRRFHRRITSFSYGVLGKNTVNLLCEETFP